MATGCEKLKKLCDFLEAAFETSDLHEFLKLGGYNKVDAKASPSLSRHDYSFVVVQELDHQGEIDPAFFERLREERPKRETDIRSLQGLWLAEDQAEPRSDLETRNGPPENPRGSSPDTELDGDLRADELRSLVDNFKARLVTALDRSRRVTGYKALHDAFHSLMEPRHRIERYLTRLPGDETVWDFIEDEGNSLGPKLQHLVEAAEGWQRSLKPARGEVNSWVRQVVASKAMFDAGISSRESDKLRSGIQLLGRVIQINFVRFNDWMYEAASHLKPEELLESLVEVRHRLESLRDRGLGEAARYWERLTEPYDRLAEICPPWTVTVNNHFRLQTIYETLNPDQFDVANLAEPEVFLGLWEPVAGSLKDLVPADEGHDAEAQAALRAAAEEVERAVMVDRKPDAARRKIKAFRGWFDTYFQNTDHELIARLCPELTGAIELVRQALELTRDA